MNLLVELKNNFLEVKTLHRVELLLVLELQYLLVCLSEFELVLLFVLVCLSEFELVLLLEY